MLTLAHPMLLVLLPLPLLVWWLVKPRHEARQALVVPFLARLAEHSGQRPASGAVIPRGGWWRWTVLLICWICTLVALARPQIIEPPITKEIPVRDMLLAVDLSGSMETQDFKDAKGETVDRLTAVKEVLDDFLAKRKGDRVGLILFGSAPFVQAPFTEDLKVCRQLLNEAQVKMAGPQTAFGDALGLAINAFDRSTVKERVLIALTDGNDTSSQVPPVKAAQIAHDNNIVIHTVAVGDPKAVGEDALDENTLKQVASTTGGLYAHATDHKQLNEIYDKLDKLETRKAQTLSHRPRRDVYWWPLALATGLSIVFHAMALLKRRAAKVANNEAPVPAGASLAFFAPFGLAAVTPTIHFIRPEWLLALIPAGTLWWWLRRRMDASLPWRGIIAPHLLPHLLSGEEKRARFGPLELVAVAWLVSILAISGPTWKREPTPFANDTAALAIVIKVSPSMKTEDIQPSRLVRATQKIHDLLKLRASAKTSLIAYAGSAHVVMPPTTDSGIIDTFAQALDPKIMPEDGDAAADALKLADQTLVDAGGGSILWITDSVASDQSAPLAAWRNSSSPAVHLFPPLYSGQELDALKANAHPADVSIVRFTADDSDVQELTREAKFADLSGEDANGRWAESGYWLTPVVAGLLLPFFRKGWMVSTVAAK
jgi:Ca-activated chloride channel family protein